MGHRMTRGGDTAQMVNKPWRVIIVGGGFGGLSAAQALNADSVDVTLIDRQNFHLFQPLLYQVATGSLSAGQIAAPLRSVLSRQKNTRVLLGSVEDIDPESKQVTLADGARFPYDSLIVATGSQSSYFGNDAWREWAPGLKSIEEATNIRDKILYAFEVAERTTDPTRRSAWLTFAIVGAGPTGVELAGAIGEIARQTLKNDFRTIHPQEARIILMDGAPRILMSFPADLSAKAHRALAKLGVEIMSGVMVKNIDSEGLTIAGAEVGVRHISAKTVIWAGGITASPLASVLASRTKTELGKGGKLEVSPDLTVANYPDIFVIGDLAATPDVNGKLLPGVAQVAMQEGVYAAKSILAKVKGKTAPPPFKYFDKGSLAVIGRASAVADIFGLHISGLWAWLVWVFIHLMYIVQYESRLLIFVQWAIEDLTFSRGARLITHSAASEFNFNHDVGVPRGVSHQDSIEV